MTEPNTVVCGRCSDLIFEIDFNEKGEIILKMECPECGDRNEVLLIDMLKGLSDMAPSQPNRPLKLRSGFLPRVR